MDGAARAASVRRAAPPRLGVVGAAQLDDVSRVIANDLFATEDLRVTETHLAAGGQAAVPLGWIDAKVLALDVDPP